MIKFWKTLFGLNHSETERTKPVNTVEWKAALPATPNAGSVQPTALIFRGKRIGQGINFPANQRALEEALLAIGNKFPNLEPPKAVDLTLEKEDDKFVLVITISMRPSEVPELNTAIRRELARVGFQI